MIKLPLTPIEVEKYLVKALGYEIDFDLLYNIYTSKNAGSLIGDVLSADTFNELHSMIAKGYSVKAITTNKIINIVCAECQEIESDDFKFVELTFIHDTKIIILAISKFGNDIFLDGKTVKEL